MPDAPRLTPAQEQAVTTAGCSILVSAAAGTGKTHVLAERCAHLVCQAQPPCDVDRLLVVTFTEAAAAEMRSRIGQTISRRLKANPGQGRLQRQLALLDAATITTIHAFCLQLVRRWFARIDLDPNIEVIDADEAELIRQDVLEHLFAELYDAAGKNALADGFRDLVDAYGMGRDERIGATVMDLHAFVWSLPDPSAWLQQAREHVALDENAGVLPPAMAALRRQMLLHHIEILGSATTVEADMIRALYPAGMSYARRLDDLAEHMRGWWRTIKNTDDQARLDEIVRRIAAHKPDRMPGSRGLSEQARQERDAASELSKRMYKRLALDIQRHAGVFDSGAIVDGLRRIGPHVVSLVELTELFDRRYQAVKQSEGRVDFSDLERFALALLSADASGTTPSETAIQVQDEYEHVLVDEFQDVNPVQEAVLRLASRETDKGRDDNLFAVGDVKQSIYRFRLAEPEIFVRRAEAFASTPSARGKRQTSGPGRLIWLQENFRSRSEVIDAVNAVFERLMKPQLSGMTYDEHARLAPGTRYPSDLQNAFGRPAVEFHLIEKNVGEEVAEANDDASESVLEWDAVEREALLAGRRILELTGLTDGHTPMMIFEKNDDPDGPPLRPRPIELRDIVILLRATKAKANHFERVLRNMGIAVYADLTTGYFTSLEVQDALSLLQLIDNERQDIPMAAVLRSPILEAPLNETQLAEIRLHAPDLPFCQAVHRYSDDGPDPEIRERLNRLLANLDRWRGQLRRQPLSDVLWQILTETGYWAYVGGLRNGVQRRANLIRLHERARQFGRFARQGLHRFIRFIEELDKRGRDIGIAPAVGEADNVVRIMSIHRSKGLEFPVVILPDLGKRFNLQDLRGPILFDRQRFIGLHVVDLEQGVRYPTLSSLAAADEIGRQIRAEELRILYVAMTRAREHLILLGTMPLSGIDQHRQRGRIATDGVLPIDLVGATTLLDWLVPAVACMPDGLAAWSSHARPDDRCNALLSVHAHDADAVAQWPSPERAAATAEVALKQYASLKPAKDATKQDSHVAAVIHRVIHPYAHAALGAVPAVVAASEMKRRFADEHEGGELRRPIPVGPTRLAEPKLSNIIKDKEPSLSPTERGTLIHLILQHLDLSRPCNVKDIAAQIDEMIGRDLLTERERQSVPFEPLAWFFTTDLGKRLLAEPKRVRREVPFVLGVSPDRVVPGLETEALADEVVLVRGMIDCLLQGDDGDDVIDFKTDAITRAGLDDRVSLYAPQLEIYADAVERIWQRPVAHRWLVFLSLPEIVEVPAPGTKRSPRD